MGGQLGSDCGEVSSDAVQGLWANLKFTTRFGPLSYLLYL